APDATRSTLAETVRRPVPDWLRPLKVHAMMQSLRPGRAPRKAGCSGCKRRIRAGARVLTLTAALLAAQQLPGAELRPRTLEAWETYIRLTEQRIAAELQDSQKVLTTDFLAETRSIRPLLRNGQVDIRRYRTPDAGGKEISVPDGMIHHWLGTIFVPQTTLPSLLEWIQDYDQHDRYFLEVERSDLVSRDGPEFKIFYRLRRKKVITVYYNTLHTVVYRQPDPRRASSRSFTTKIAELDQPGEPGEKEKPAGDDRGFLWRLNSYWRFQEDDGGVFVECESVSLSRSIPFGLSWLIKGYVESIPRESLEGTLTSIRNGIASANRLGASANK
ncbi:MAG: hypothetical protein ACRD88_00180, partial [Terriglobia bacterium]